VLVAWKSSPVLGEQGLERLQERVPGLGHRLARVLCHASAKDAISVVPRSGCDNLVKAIATTDTVDRPSTDRRHPRPNMKRPTSHSPANVDSRGSLAAPWRPSRHTVPAATRFGSWGDESSWSACGRGPRIASPTHIPPYHRRKVGADPLPETRVPGWPRQRAFVLRRWRGCSGCLSGTSTYHATSLSGEGEGGSQSKKTTGSTVFRDVLA